MVDKYGMKDWFAGWSVAVGNSNAYLPSAVLTDATGVALGTAGNPLVTSGAGGASSNQVQGAGASGATAVGFPVGIGAVFNSTLPVVTNGQRVDLQANANGNLRVYLTGPTTTGVDTITNNIAGVSTTTGQSASGVVPLATSSMVLGATQLQQQRSMAGSQNSGAGIGAIGFAELDGTRLTKATVNISTATTTAIVAGTAAQTVRVYKMILNFSAAQTINIISSGGASLSGAAMSFGAVATPGQLMLTFDGEPWYTSTIAEGISFVTTTTGVVTGTIYYRKEA